MLGFQEGSMPNLPKFADLTFDIRNERSYSSVPLPLHVNTKHVCGVPQSVSHAIFQTPLRLSAHVRVSALHSCASTVRVGTLTQLCSHL